MRADLTSKSNNDAESLKNIVLIPFSSPPKHDKCVLLVHLFTLLTPVSALPDCFLKTANRIPFVSVYYGLHLVLQSHKFLHPNG